MIRLHLEKSKNTSSTRYSQRQRSHGKSPARSLAMDGAPIYLRVVPPDYYRNVCIHREVDNTALGFHRSHEGASAGIVRKQWRRLRPRFGGVLSCAAPGMRELDPFLAYTASEVFCDRWGHCSR